MPQRRRPELTEVVIGERFVGHRRSTRTFAPDRICSHPRCATRLSIYNAGWLCAVHAPHGQGGTAPETPEDPTELAAS